MNSWLFSLAGGSFVLLSVEVLHRGLKRNIKTWIWNRNRTERSGHDFNQPASATLLFWFAFITINQSGSSGLDCFSIFLVPPGKVFLLILTVLKLADVWSGAGRTAGVLYQQPVRGEFCRAQPSHRHGETVGPDPGHSRHGQLKGFLNFNQRKTELYCYLCLILYQCYSAVKSSLVLST